MRDLSKFGRPASLLAAFALTLAGSPGCGPEQPTPPGTNAATGEVNGGPGTKPLTGPSSGPSVAVPYGGSGSGVAPPVSPAGGSAPSGDSNSGQTTGKTAGVGSDATTEGAKPATSNPK